MDLTTYIKGAGEALMPDTNASSAAPFKLRLKDFTSSLFIRLLLSFFIIIALLVTFIFYSVFNYAPGHVRGAARGRLRRSERFRTHGRTQAHSDRRPQRPDVRFLHDRQYARMRLTPAWIRASVRIAGNFRSSSFL
ncbi:hypothetical protein [Cohnella sp. OV330]|uniref:hypothetical protein n=1 Tax=Cohnella sp. OV330 TaxID=1855288 RepID=UPI000B801B57|nr:hypothetical protein [Cohnella sp. OV330]